MRFFIFLLALCLATPALAAAPQLPAPAIDEQISTSTTTEQIVLAGGCFWGIEAVFEHVRGVTDVVSGYSGGSAQDAQYKTVSTGTTGHAEAVRVTYDPRLVSVGQLLQIFFTVAHDPTQLNRQGPDHGTQYRSAIFATTPEQQRIADAYIAQLQAAHVFPAPIVTQSVMLDRFYPAENYHQNYLRLHPDQPYIVINDAPKIAALQAEFPAFYKN